MKFLAYLDPGTGSFIVQAVIGAVVGASYIVRRQIGRAFSAIKKKFSKRTGRSN